MLEEDKINEQITITCELCEKKFTVPMVEPDEELPDHCQDCPYL